MTQPPPMLASSAVLICAAAKGLVPRDSWIQSSAPSQQRRFSAKDLVRTRSIAVAFVSEAASARAAHLARLVWMNFCAHEDGVCAHEYREGGEFVRTKMVRENTGVRTKITKI